MRLRYFAVKAGSGKGRCSDLAATKTFWHLAQDRPLIGVACSGRLYAGAKRRRLSVGWCYIPPSTTTGSGTFVSASTEQPAGTRLPSQRHVAHAQVVENRFEQALFLRTQIAPAFLLQHA
jgi:hypothetical protein